MRSGNKFAVNANDPIDKREAYKGALSMVFALVLLLLLLIDNGTSYTFCYSLGSRSSLFFFYNRKTTLKGKTTREVGFDAIQDGGRRQYGRLLQWLQYNVTQSWISSKIKISPSVISNSSRSGYGVFSKGAISEGELLFVIPSHGCISFSSSIMNDAFGERLRSLLKGAGPGRSTVGLAGWLAKERLKLFLDNQSSVFFQPYLSVLPWTKEEQDHVLFYSEQQIQSLSQLYPQAAEDAKGLRLEVEIAKKLLCPIILECLIGSKDTSLSRYNYFKELCYDAITAAFVIILTRSFYSTDIEEERLVPLLDMLQHDETPTIRHESDVKGNVHVYARCNIEEGKEIYNQYASRDSMEPHQWLTRFGFLPD